MAKLTVQKIETLCRARAKVSNERRGGNCPIKWQDALALSWQTRNQVFKGCNGKAVFNPFTLEATSYKHWVFVKLINGKIVFNNYGYSQTTRTHQYAVSSVMRDLGIKIDLEVSMRESLDSFDKAVLHSLYKQLFNLKIVANRRNARDMTKDIQDAERKIKTAMKLGAFITPAEIDAIKVNCDTWESDGLKNQRLKRDAKKHLRDNEKILFETNKVVDLTAFIDR